LKKDKLSNIIKDVAGNEIKLEEPVKNIAQICTKEINEVM